ncbi:MAG: adenine deaminase C-terminal domain-containing protein [Opitutales bacterium]
MKYTSVAALCLSLLGLIQSLYAHGDEKFEFSEEILTRQKLMRVAMGHQPADKIVTVGKMLDVFSGTWKENWDIVISGERIAWTGPSGEWAGEADSKVAYPDLYAVPGFGESHKHIESSHLTPEYEAALVIPFGNTWTIEGSHEFSNIAGEHNVDFWLTPMRRGSPLKIFVELGSATPPTPYERGGGYYGYEEVRKYMQEEEWVIGLGEVMDWPRLWNTDLPGSQRIWEVIQAAMDEDGVIEGHGSGLRDLPSINAFSASGLESDHEVRMAEEAWDKLSRGVFLQLRYHAIPVVIPYLMEKGIQDWSHICFTTDDRNAAESLELGTQNYNLRLAIEAGAPVEKAYAMATLYPAKHAQVDDKVGSIAPGRYADLVLLSDPKKVAIDTVYVNGKHAAEKGKYLLEVPKIDWPEWAKNTINFGKTITPEDLAIRPPDPAQTEVTAALLRPFYFEEDFMEEKMSVKNGQVYADPEKGISKVALADRFHSTGQVAKMFWRDVGPLNPKSAVACTVAHDLHNAWALGNDDEAMALALNTLAEMNGGWVLVKEGEVIAKVTFEIGGIMSARTPQEVADELENLFAAADTMDWIGAPGLPRRMIFAWLTCTPWKWVLVAPFEGCPQGFVNVTNGETHPVVW